MRVYVRMVTLQLRTMGRCAVDVNERRAAMSCQCGMNPMGELADPSLLLGYTRNTLSCSGGRVIDVWLSVTLNPRRIGLPQVSNIPGRRFYNRICKVQLNTASGRLSSLQKTGLVIA